MSAMINRDVTRAFSWSALDKTPSSDSPHPTAYPRLSPLLAPGERQISASRPSLVLEAILLDRYPPWGQGWSHDFNSMPINDSMPTSANRRYRLMSSTWKFVTVAPIFFVLLAWLGLVSVAGCEGFFSLRPYDYALTNKRLIPCFSRLPAPALLILWMITGTRLRLMANASLVMLTSILRTISWELVNSDQILTPDCREFGQNGNWFPIMADSAELVNPSEPCHPRIYTRLQPIDMVWTGDSSWHLSDDS